MKILNSLILFMLLQVFAYGLVNPTNPLIIRKVRCISDLNKTLTYLSGKTGISFSLSGISGHIIQKAPLSLFHRIRENKKLSNS